MMKKHAAILLISTITLGACSMPNTPTVKQELEQSVEADTLENGTTENDFGFANKAANAVDNRGENDGEEYQLDRQVTADAISRYGASIPGIENVSTVVTDEEVLISYQVAQDAEDLDRNEVADQVKRSALSVIPRWYHVYLTDDPSLRVNVESIAQTHLTKVEMEDAIASTIDLMKESSPQGFAIDDGENANGETKDEEKRIDKEIDLAPAAMDVPSKKTADA